MNVTLPQLIREHPFGRLEIPPKRMIWTQSSVGQFRKCKRKFFWKYMMRLLTKYKDRNLVVGHAFHETLGQWYKGKRVDMAAIVKPRIDELAKIVTESAGYYSQEDLDKFHITTQTFAGMMEGYSAQYAGDRQNWRIDRRSIEAQFKIDMGDFDFAGKIDLVASERTSKGNFLVEHKTASSIGESYVDRLPLDTQIRGYLFGAIKGLSIPVNEVLYDVVRKCKLRRKSNETIDEFTNRVRSAYLDSPQDYFYREQLMFAKSDLDCFEYELRQTHKEFTQLVHQGLDFSGYHDLPAENPRQWTPNDKMCNEFFRTCEYLQLCTTGLDRGTAIMYRQNDRLHDELEDME